LSATAWIKSSYIPKLNLEELPAENPHPDMDLIAHEQLAGFNEKLEDHKMHLKTFMATRFYETIERMAQQK